MPSEKRPLKRGDCKAGPRPCPYISCKWHTIWLRTEYQATSKNVPKWLEFSDEKIIADIAKLPETCVLDVADKGGVTLKTIGNILGVTRERIRQLVDARQIRRSPMRKLRHLSRRHLIEDFVPEGKPVMRPGIGSVRRSGAGRPPQIDMPRVLEMLKAGYSRAEISKRLGISQPYLADFACKNGFRVHKKHKSRAIFNRKKNGAKT